MPTTTTTKSKTTVYTKRTEAPVRAEKLNEDGENLADYVSFAEYKREFFRQLKKRYGKI